MLDASLGPRAGDVRVFSGRAAMAACRALDAVAYALDGDVVARSRSLPRSVLAHELHHAVEQRSLPTYDGLSRRASDPAERRAEAFARGQPAGGAGGRAVPRLSLYSLVDDGAGTTYQVADALDMVVNQDTSAHELYASAAQIASSEATLRGLDSILTLRGDPTETIQVTGPDPGGGTAVSRFVGPRFDAIRAGDRGQYLRWGVECPEVATLQQALVDAECPLPTYGVDGRFYSETRGAVVRFQGVKAKMPASEVDGVVGPKTLAALDAYLGAGAAPTRTVTLPRVVPTNLRNGTSGPSMTMFNDCGYCANSIMGTLDWRQPTITSKQSPRGVFTHGGGERTTGRGWVHSMRDEILDTVMGTPAGGGFDAYKALSAEEKRQIEEDTGLNDFAAPGVGEAYALARDMSGGSTYNFHWGAVIMASGSDRTVLENSYNASLPEENNAWEYYMYGPGGLSFHSRYAGAWAGPDPVTFAVRA